MSKRGFSSAIIILIGFAAAAIGLFFYLSQKTELVLPPNETACTLEAMICPDGSAVGRTGPNCEFADCLPAQAGPSASPLPESYKASFEIYTLGTKRVFTAAMYHNQSSDAYLKSADPSVIHVEKAGITWQEFFDTLPFQIDSECLVTGTSQTFCSGKDGSLQFFLNGDENPNVLSSAIMPGDELVVRYE